MIPTWLRRHLEQAGRWNTDGVGRSLTGGRCRSCSAVVIRALDDDVAGLPVTVDAQPVNALGEALALMQGRTTYTVASRGGRWLLDPRDRYRIAAHRPDVVVAEHQCHSPALPADPQPEPTVPARQQEPAW